jgi:hypothetical protein
VARPVRSSSAARPLDEEAQTKFMSRPILPSRTASARRAPVFTEERTLVDVPRPIDGAPSSRAPRPTVDEDRTIVAPLVFPKAAARTTLLPSRSSYPVSSAPPVSKQTPSSIRPAAPRPSQPPPLPARASAPPPPAVPNLVPPPPPPATKLFDGPSKTPLPAPVPSEQTSSPALVRDVTPSTPPPAPTAKRAREPMILLAAALGVLGMIFTMGIVVGLVVSLRSHAGAPEASAERSAAPVVAAAAAAPAVVAAAPVVTAAPVKVAETKVPPVQGPADTVAVAKPAVVVAAVSAPAAPARVVHYAPVAMATPVARPAAPSAPAKRGRAASGDADLDAANAASDLAKAQLEASLR